jgi:hypothetical protein
MDVHEKVDLRVCVVGLWDKGENVPKMRNPFTLAGTQVYGLKVKGFPSGLG